MAAQQRAADVAAGFGGLSKVLRMALQSGVLGIGAWLVINQQATGGIIIASGHFSMAFPSLTTFYIGLALIVVGIISVLSP